MLPGCLHRSTDRTTTPVAVTITDRPPSDLLACPAPPAGVPRHVAADIPAPARAALIRLALAYRQATDQLARLINWHDPAACALINGTAGNRSPSGKPLDLLPPAAR
jgi:hypothetical protein